jgi:signal transduction histidine kinase
MATLSSYSNSPSIEALKRTNGLALAGRLALELMHEINNPLDAVGNLAYLAREEAENAQLVRSYMFQIEEQVTTLKKLVGQPLGLVRPSSKKKREQLVGLVDAAVRIHRKTIAAKQVRLVPEVPEELALEIHAGELLQVLSNLIANSLDALPAGGSLRLRIHRASSEVHIVVADNGHGIPEEHSQSVFEPFFTTKHDQGTGLGLHISKKIVEGYKGRIKMRSSVRQGKSGTIFRISLPCLGL